MASLSGLGRLSPFSPCPAGASVVTKPRIMTTPASRPGHQERVRPLPTVRALFHRLPAVAAALLILSGCQTIDPEAPARAAMNDAIRAEPRGSYFIGRRMYKTDYKMWGWVREPGKPWTTARLVMLNEQTTQAPDRAGGTLGRVNSVRPSWGRLSGLKTATRL